MSETIAHTRLVGVIVDWVTRTHGDLPGLCLFCDSPTVLTTEKPSPIAGFYPDVLAVTSPCDLTLIGEAKTLPDLETSRSFRQIVAFLNFLAFQPHPKLIIATPWQATATARNIVALAKRECGTTEVPVMFLNEQRIAC